MRLVLSWGALLVLGATVAVASCGESSQSWSGGEGGDSLGGALGQAGSKSTSSPGGDGGRPASSGVGGETEMNGGAPAVAGMGGNGAPMTPGASGDAATGGGGEGGSSEPSLPLQCTNGQKDLGETCVDCGGPCPACELIWKCSDAACDGAPSACVGSGLCPGGPKPAECLHATSCDSLNILPASYTFGVANGCSPGQDECRVYECRCSCPE